MNPRFTSPPSPARVTAAPAPSRPRFLSEAECHDIANRLAKFAKGGGYTVATIVSSWRGSTRWARNLVSEASEVRDDHIMVNRCLEGASNQIELINDSSDAALLAAARRAERMATLAPAIGGWQIYSHYEPEPFTAPQLFFDSTYQLDAAQRDAAAQHLAKAAADAGLQSAGYIEASAHSQATITSWGYARYFQYTWARYSVTVRDPKQSGSGWAGVDWPDWTRIDGDALTQLALEKCLKSRNPVAIEPGRYTTILEPQAVYDFIGKFLTGRWWSPMMAKYQVLDREGNETRSFLPWFDRPDPAHAGTGYAKFGQRIIDERITITSDPLDPELGFPPFKSADLDSYAYRSLGLWSDVYHPVTWIKNGVLTNLAYDRDYGIKTRSQNTGLPLQGAFRMSGGDTSLEEMIATTKRGLLVTRFDGVTEFGYRMPDATKGSAASLLCRGYTRDGLWLIENGKISKAVRNLEFTESIVYALNNIEQLGVPQRTFHPAGWHWWDEPQPAIVPPMKIRDFSFTALTSAI